MTLLQKYFEHLREWSKTVRLVGATTDDALQELADDSRMLLPYLPSGPARIVDVGSGAGFPGIVLAIERPDVQITALEPHRRKWAFLRDVRRALGIQNFTAIQVEDTEHLRAPDFSPYDVAVSKAAFAPLDWLERAPLLVRNGGTVLGMLGTQDIDLPESVERFDYKLLGKSRAILRLVLRKG